MTDEIKSTHLKLRIPKEKKEQIRQYAYSKGLSMSSYIRYVLSEDIEKNVVQDDMTILITGGNDDVKK